MSGPVALETRKGPVAWMAGHSVAANLIMLLCLVGGAVPRPAVAASLLGSGLAIVAMRLGAPPHNSVYVYDVVWRRYPALG